MRTILIVLIILLIPISINYAGERRVTIASIEAPPFSGDKLRNKGYGCEVVVEGFAAVGYDAQIVFYPWKRALEMVKKGYV